MVTPFRAPVKSDFPATEVVQLAGDQQPGWHAPQSGVRRPGPMRLAVYHQNYSGQHTWNTWSNLDFPPELREQVASGHNGQAAALTTLSRVTAPGAAPRPIPLSDYTLQTRMTYVGTIDANGRINR